MCVFCVGDVKAIIEVTKHRIDAEDKQLTLLFFFSEGFSYMFHVVPKIFCVRDVKFECGKSIRFSADTANGFSML